MEEPPLVEADTPGHYYKCWFPVGTDAGREALERNLAVAGLSLTQPRVRAFAELWTRIQDLPRHLEVEIHAIDWQAAAGVDAIKVYASTPPNTGNGAE